MYKRMLCLVLAGVLLMSLLPIASADDGGVVLFDTLQSESSPAPESAPEAAAAPAPEAKAPPAPNAATAPAPESAPEAAAAPAPEAEAPPAPNAATPTAPEAAGALAPEAKAPPAPESTPVEAAAPEPEVEAPAPEAATPPAPENEVRMILPDQPQEAGYVTYEFAAEDRVVEVQIVGDGEVLTQPATPEAPEGRRFTGWLDEEGRPFRSFGPQTVPAGQESVRRLTAAFVPVLRAWFMSDIDGGKVVSTWETEEEHGSVPMYLLGVEKHQKLIGWTLEKGNPDGVLVAFPYPIERETRFYPVVRDTKWVTFDTLGGMPLAPAGVIQGERVDAPVPVRSGYTFLG